MTIETKTTIQISDVKAIEFECKTCHRIVSLPIEVAKEPPFECDCKNPRQWMSYGGEMYSALSGLMTLLGRFGKVDNEPFAMRLVITELSARASRDSGA